MVGVLIITLYRRVLLQIKIVQGAKYVEVCENKEGKVNMVLGAYVGIEDVKMLMEKALIGNSMGKQVSEGPMRRWIEKLWLGFLGYLPRFHIFVRG